MGNPSSQGHRDAFQMKVDAARCASGALIIQKVVPVDGDLWCSSSTPKHSLPRLFADGFGCTRADIPHAELHAPLRDDSNLVARSPVVNFRVELDILHYAVAETGRESSFARMVYVSFEVRREPECDIRYTALDLEVEIRSQYLATL